jgi:hypothetical protein
VTPNSPERTAILQTGRLGDLWFTLPLAHHLHQQGQAVEVVYDAQYGNPFTFTPYVTARPMKMPGPLESPGRWSYAINQAIHQVRLNQTLKKEYARVIWRQIFPYRWLHTVHENRPYPYQWYAAFPEINFRRAPTTLECADEKTILLLDKSQSVHFHKDDSYARWFEENLQKLVEATHYTPVYVASGSEPDHPKYRTWRGSQDDYQRSIARCGIVYGTSTSAHVLGQLIGKAVVPLYGNRKVRYDTIGEEDACLFPGERLDAAQLDRVVKKLGQPPG